jgi:ADP-ribosyl-[dinitrogen reductase] hydrolase
MRAKFPVWLHLPIRDLCAPDSVFESEWICAGSRLRGILRGGGRVLVHCRGGIGRAGMIAARLLIELGERPEAAIAAVRAARSPSAIETPAQIAHVLACRPALDKALV